MAPLASPINIQNNGDLNTSTLHDAMGISSLNLNNASHAALLRASGGTHHKIDEKEKLSIEERTDTGTNDRLEKDKTDQLI
jgi:hypothetical protein